MNVIIFFLVVIIALSSVGLGCCLGMSAGYKSGLRDAAKQAKEREELERMRSALELDKPRPAWPFEAGRDKGE
jgi:sulfite exporter TauE/SafE